MVSARTRTGLTSMVLLLSLSKSWSCSLFSASISWSMSSPDRLIRSWTRREIRVGSRICLPGTARGKATNLDEQNNGKVEEKVQLPYALY